MGAQDDGEQGAAQRGAVERIVFPLVRESLFLPVTFAIVGHIALGIAAAFVYVARDGDYPLVVLLLAAAACTASLVRAEVRDARRLGALSAWLAFTWVLSAVLAWSLFHWL